MSISMREETPLKIECHGLFSLTHQFQVCRHWENYTIVMETNKWEIKPQREITFSKPKTIKRDGNWLSEFFFPFPLELINLINICSFSIVITMMLFCLFSCFSILSRFVSFHILYVYYEQSLLDVSFGQLV